jgi:flagellin
MSDLTVNFDADASRALLNLDATNAALSESMLELSSGLAIQYSRQGPARWSISQFLGFENAGDSEAISNTQQGASLLSIASAAVNQIAGLLDRMEQLAVSSANAGTMNPSELAANEAEFQAIQDEINAISANTTYGGMALLDGTYGASSGVLATSQPGNVNVPAYLAFFGKFYVGPSNDTIQVRANGVAETITLASGAYDATGIVNAINTGTVSGGTVPVTASIDPNGYLVLSAPGSIKITGGTFVLQTNAGVRVDFGPTYVFLPTGQTSFSPGAPFQVGYQAGDVVHIPIPRMDLIGLGLTSASVATPSAASSAIAALQSAVSYVSDAGATIGDGIQELSGLEADLRTATTNVGSADSTVVDVNMANKMSSLATDQILLQSGLAMLAQAQADPTLVLRLL